ncbi:hypothetical protein GY21_01140 [Cryobacterium roopkundense]|uniref:Uncharacterized protein n=1 Tax=Cryobacterium roopkundense TaxID=1001240 RepID=A0A099JTL0_9MICO|nr:hypothetical protein [Cryobacterium roopkundense]KGJ81724.1 hypothetical protein GY21_01140 [Cryobacterium roopkundense]MBB5642484.1 hypothetical protein [Cryobacterium roopkundense]
MHSGPGPHWSVAEDWGSPLAHHLVVRDMVGAREFDALRLPRTAASVGVVPGIPRRLARTLANEWRLWWNRCVAEEPGPVNADFRDAAGPAMPQGTHLSAFVLQHWPQIRACAEQMNERAGAAARFPGDLSITHAVADVSATLRRPTRPFSLSIEVLSLADTRLWRVAPTRVLVSTDLRLDAPAFGLLLHPVLRDLA